MTLYRSLLVIVDRAGLGLVGAEGSLDRVVAVLHDKVDERLEGSVTVVVDELSAASGLELESGET